MYQTSPVGTVFDAVDDPNRNLLSYTTGTRSVG